MALRYPRTRHFSVIRSLFLMLGISLITSCGGGNSGNSNTNTGSGNTSNNTSNNGSGNSNPQASANTDWDVVVWDKDKWQ